AACTTAIFASDRRDGLGHCRRFRQRRRTGSGPPAFPAAGTGWNRLPRMKILILGAGQVGSSVAAALASENNDITVVDTDPSKLRELAERLDIRTIVGHASLPSVLGHAGAEDADL